MTRFQAHNLLFAAALFCLVPFLRADNPIFKHIRTADPSAQVWNDGKVWVYTSHDQDDAVDYGSMDGYHVFSSYDLVNWTDHGEILHSRDVSWGISQGGFMFAPDAAYKDGVYYLFFPHMAEGWNWRIGVATSDKPEGPFMDVGHYIEGTDHIDPMCYVDDDGQAYLMWGGDYQEPKIARLKDNMEELAEAPRVIEYGGDNFGEGPFMHKRNGIYYFSWAHQSGYPYKAYYAMGASPYGPFEFKGALNGSPPGSQDHHSIIEYHGQLYYFYHIGNYKGGSMYRRNVCVDYLYPNEDGSYKRVVMTTQGVSADLIGSTPGQLAPGSIEAEDFFRQNGIDAGDVNGTVKLDNGDWVEYVLEILGTDDYRVRLTLNNGVNESSLRIMVNDELAESIPVDEATAVAEATIGLFKGKHTLKIECVNTVIPVGVMEIDRIDLESGTTYYQIVASATDGGKIEPEGVSYVPSAGSITYELTNDVGFKISDIVVDDVSMGSAGSYMFQNVSADHSIEAVYSSCATAELTAFIRINNESKKQFEKDTVLVGDSVELSAGTGETGTWSWTTPAYLSSKTNKLQIENATTEHSGLYSVVFVSSGGCKSRVDLNLTVAQPTLDVYEAEDWTEQSGVQTEGTQDIGGGENVGWIENNDWCQYRIEFEKTASYDFVVRVATATNGGRIELSVDGKTVTVVNVEGSESNGWQDWYTTDPVSIQIEKGRRDVRLTFKGGGGYLLNINWFDFIPSGDSSVHSDAGSTGPDFFALFPVYPNPFNPETQIRYQLDTQGKTTLIVLNALGEQVRSLEKETQQQTGIHQTYWDGKDDTGRSVTSGVYFLALNSGDRKQVQKLILMK